VLLGELEQGLRLVVFVLGRFLELLCKVLLESVHSRLDVLFLGVVVTHQWLKVLFDPNLVVVGHLAHIEEIEFCDGLNKIDPEHVGVLVR
jgi:hypothetical protein